MKFTDALDEYLLCIGEYQAFIVYSQNPLQYGRQSVKDAEAKLQTARDLVNSFFEMVDETNLIP